MKTRLLGAVSFCASAWLALSACGGAQTASAPAEAPGSAGAPESAPDRSGLPAPGPTIVWGPPAPGAWQLENGVRVLHRTYGSVPLISLLLVIPRGTETDPPAQAGLTHMMADLLDEGAGDLDALGLSERLQALATDFSATANVDYVLVAMNTIAENFGPSVDLLADIVRRPKLDKQEFERRKAQLVAQALASEADPHTGRRVAMYRALFGDGYAGTVPTGTPDTLGSITYADVKAQYARLMVSEQATFVVTGGIEQKEAAGHIQRAFGDWAGRASVKARPLTTTADTGKLYFVDYPAAAQSVIGVVRRAPGASAEDLAPATVFNRSFGEAFTSRVNMNLREAKGYTYGAVSMFQRFRDAGFFGIFSDVRTDVTRASLDEVLKELSELCGPRPLTTEERDASVGGLLLGYPAGFESIGLLGARFAQLPIYDRPLDWFEKWPERVSAVTLEQANETGRRYCQPAEFAVVVAGDKAKVAPTLKDLPYEWVEVDARGKRR
jgi:zinc protease